MRQGRAATLGAGFVLLTAAPSVMAIGPLRRRVFPGLSGVTGGDHVALTFDDGPDPASTPAFLELLAEHRRRATFFVLGSQVAANPGLVKEISDAGHELAIHGWTHRCVLVTPPTRLGRELRAAQRAVEDVTGAAVRWYRPPYGVLGTEALLACRALELTPVLWSAWGREWERSATPTRIVTTVRRTLRPGGTILLHDTDRHAPHGDWRRNLDATRLLLAGFSAEAPLGPFGEHVAADSSPPGGRVIVKAARSAGFQSSG